jgi:addiction module HigA family antidote
MINGAYASNGKIVPQKTSKSSIIIGKKMGNKLEPIAPGEILLEEFLKPLGVTQNQLSRDIDVAVSRIAAIIKGERSITADTALRFGRYFGTSPEMWLNLQTDYDIRKLRSSSWTETEKRIRPLNAA